MTGHRLKGDRSISSCLDWWFSSALPDDLSPGSEMPGVVGHQVQPNLGDYRPHRKDVGQAVCLHSSEHS